MRIALVFPGQGSQTVGMGRALAGPPAGAVFRAADEALGEPLSTAHRGWSRGRRWT